MRLKYARAICETADSPAEALRKVATQLESAEVFPHTVTLSYGEEWEAIAFLEDFTNWHD